MKPFIFSAFICAVLLNPISAAADPVTQAGVNNAQSQMLARIHDAVARHAAEIEIDPMYVSFCQSEMHLRTFSHPTNGYIPFGVNYNSITDSERLEHVLSAREAYETSFMFLCLANAKNALRQAKKP
jgi:hypothetical protein